MNVAPNLRRLARWVLHASVAFGLLGLVIWQANPWELSDPYDNFDFRPAVGAVVLNLPVLLLLTFRGRFILSRLRHDVPLMSLLPISTLGNVAAALTPAAAGDLLRTPFFKERHDIPYADGLAMVIYERGFSLFILSVSTGVAAVWTALSVGIAVAVTVGSFVVMLAAPSAAAILLERVRPVLPRAGVQQNADSTLQRALGALGRSLESLLLLLRDGWGTINVTLANLSIFAVLAMQVWMVVRALGMSLSPAESWMVLGVASLAGIVTFLPLGLGTVDATMAAVVGATEDGFSSGAAAAVLLRATVTMPLILAAIGSYLFLMRARAGATP